MSFLFRKVCILGDTKSNARMTPRLDERGSHCGGSGANSGSFDHNEIVLLIFITT